jgi:hypothetical protein
MVWDDGLRGSGVVHAVQVPAARFHVRLETIHPFLEVPTITQALGNLNRAGLLRETAGRQRDNLFDRQRCLDLLNETTTTPSEGGGGASHG